MTGGMTVLLDVRLLVGRGAFAPLSWSPTMRSLLPPPAWGLVEPGVTSMEALPLTFCRTCSPARAHALRLVHHGLSTVARALWLMPLSSCTVACPLWLVPHGSCPAAHPPRLIYCGSCPAAHALQLFHCGSSPAARLPWHVLWRGCPSSGASPPFPL